jgi:hypothetical protein
MTQSDVLTSIFFCSLFLEMKMSSSSIYIPENSPIYILTLVLLGGVEATPVGINNNITCIIHLHSRSDPRDAFELNLRYAFRELVPHAVVGSLVSSESLVITRSVFMEY